VTSFQRLLSGICQIPQQVEVIGDLNRLRRSPSRSIGVTTGVVTTDELGAPMRAQPCDECIGLAIW
jgi:hypothetical protein